MWIPSQRLAAKKKKKKHPINHSVSVTDNLDLNSVTRLVRL